VRSLAVVAVALVACKADAPSSVTITAQAPPVGQVSILDKQERSTHTLTFHGEELVIVEDLTERRRTEVLEVSATAPTKLRVTYEARTERETADGQTRDTTSPLVGNTYVVWRDGHDVRAILDTGGAITDGEAALLADDHVDLGRPAQMEALITSRPAWNRGEVVEVPADDLATRDHEQGVTEAGTQTTAVTLTLTSVAGGIATFTTVMQVETDNASLALSSTITGTIKVEIAHARPVEITTNVSGRGMRLSGPAAGSAIQVASRGLQKYSYQ
jgi:hypothetical protein